MSNSSMIANGNFFAENPDKILGEAYTTSSRYGKQVTKYKGDLSSLEKIDVPLNFLPKSLIPLDTRTSDVEDSVSELVTSVGANENIDKAIKEGAEEVVEKAKRKSSKKSVYSEPTNYELLSFEDVFNQYNPEISLDELNAFAYYKAQIGQPLGGEWVKSGMIIEPSEEQVTEWVSKQILCYYKSQLVPAYLYFAENIYEKRFVLEREKEDIVSIYGEEVYNAQHSRMLEAFNKKFSERLRLDIPDDPSHPDFGRRLTLLPTSEFAKTFMIKSLMDELPFKMKMVTAKSSKDFQRPDFLGVIQGKGSSWGRDNKEYEELSLVDAFQLWLVKNRANIRYTSRSNEQEVISVYINRRPRPKDEFKETWKRIQGRAKQNGDRLFMEFLGNVILENDRIRIETQWQQQYSPQVLIDYDKVPVAFRVSKYWNGEPMEIRWEKREAVAFMMSEGAGAIAYGVGYGKTSCSVFTILQFIDCGYCTRPMLVVPQQTYKQWISEIRSLAPHIPINDLYNLSNDYINEITGVDGITKVKEVSITLLTYEGFEKIGFSEPTSDKLLVRLYDILNQGGAEELMGKKKNEREKASFHERLESIIGRAQTGTMINIEDLGIDFMSVDESHSMKKIFTSVKSKPSKDEEESEVKTRSKQRYSIQSGTPSTIALKGFMIAQYILENNYQRNVQLLTATPFTNSALEIFSFLALIAYKRLEESQINNLTDFFDNYIEVSDELVINNQLKPVRREIVKGFRNLPALQELIYRFVNFKDADMPDARGRVIKVDRPNKIVLPYTHAKIDGVSTLLPEEEQVSSVIPLTPIQETMMKEIIAYAEGKIKFSSMCGANNKIGGITGDISDDQQDTTEAEEMDESNLDDDEKAGVVALRSMNFARNLALSPYLFKCSGMTNPDHIEYIQTSSKLTYVMGCVRSVKKYHEDYGEPISGQIIYMDRGIEYFGLIKKYLVEEIGFKEHEVGIIVSGLPKEGVKSKSHIQNLFLGKSYDEATKNFNDIPDEDRIKVLIGSSSIKEGMNLQKHTTVMYDCFLDWNPTDFVQFQGRGWRQGNLFENIRIVVPLCENSLDIFIFQKLGEKSDRINQLWNLDGKTSILRLDEFNPKELKFALVRDPEVLARLDVQDEIAKIDDTVSANESEIKTLEGIKDDHEQTVAKEKDILIKEAQSVRGSKVKGASSTEQLIALVMDAIKTQQDDNGHEFQRQYKGANSFHAWGVTNGFDEFKAAYRRLKRDTEKILNPKQIKIKDIDKYIKWLKSENDKLSEQAKTMSDDKTIKAKAQEIEEEREAKQMGTQPVKQRIKDFERLNWMLSVKKMVNTPASKSVPVALKTWPPTDAQGLRRIDDEAIRELDSHIESLPETKELHTISPDVYSPERDALHKEIIDKFISGKACIVNGEPIAVLTCGVPGSGKSTYLKSHYSWMLSGKALHIDADRIREELPEYQGWNAAVTHRETSDIVAQMLDSIGHPCKYDLVFDGTMNKAKNYIPLVKQIKKLGYKIFIVYVKVATYKIAMQRAMKRYQRTGRFVPKYVIDESWNSGLEAFKDLAPLIDGWVIVDGVISEVVEKGGMDIPVDRNYAILSKPDDSDDETELLQLKAKAQKQKIEILKLKLKRTVEPANIPDNPFSTFIDIVKKSSSVNEAMELVREHNNVPKEVSDAFFAQYNPKGNLTPKQAFKVFYDEHKPAGSPHKSTTEKKETISELIAGFPEGKIIIAKPDLGNDDSENKFEGAGIMVFNKTDGKLAYPLPFAALDQAQTFITESRKKFKKQGYYKTADGQKISPEDVELSIITNTSEIAELVAANGESAKVKNKRGRKKKTLSK